MAIQTALQLYSLRFLGEKDFPGMLKQVADAGFTAVEFARYGGMQVSDVKPIMDDLGLKTIGAHVAIDRFANEMDTVIEELKTLEAEFAIVPWLAPEDRPTTREAALALAETLNAYGMKVRAEGLRFGYHNHDFELAKVDDTTTIFDLIIESTDPALVDIQLDVYWAQYGGGDVIDLMKRLAGRVPTLHIKDAEWPYTGVPAEGSAISIDYPAVLAVAKDTGVEWAIVEQDKQQETDPVGFVQQKLRNLESLLAG
jgi:sugar phosphate isomerase/epimerase